VVGVASTPGAGSGRRLWTDLARLEIAEHEAEAIGLALSSRLVLAVDRRECSDEHRGDLSRRPAENFSIEKRGYCLCTRVRDLGLDTAVAGSHSRDASTSGSITTR